MINWSEELLNLKNITFAGVMGVGIASMSSAATIQATFDLAASPGSSAYGNQGNSFTLIESGLSAEFKGNSFSSVGIDQSRNMITSATVRNGNIHRWRSGAGVVNSRSDNSHTVDGSGWKDYVEIAFSQDVMLSEVKFSYFSATQVERTCSWYWSWATCDNTRVDDDDFRWMYDSSEDGKLGVGDWISANENANPFRDFDSVTASVFGFGAFEWNDDWKLKKVTVTFDDSIGNEPPAVPLPAGGALLVGAIGGLAMLRRRKASRSA
ncbi:MAG: VPLPA-CTERM sorting domain-containing protein [Pseudomonadota bacterium]